MTPEQFIEKNLLLKQQSNHSVSSRITQNIINRTLDLYKCNDFTNLDGLILEAEKEISFKTTLVEILSDGTTAKQLAGVLGCSVSTARQKLNDCAFASCDKEKRPYRYGLLC